MLTESYAGAAEMMRNRMVARVVYDARLDVINELERTGELPAELASGLRDRFEAESTAR
jgi:hypothetical protein